MKMRWLALVAMIGGWGSGSSLGQGLPSGSVDLCTIVANIRSYSGQQVLVTAFLGAGAEQDVLYDPECQDGVPLVYVSFNPKVSGRMKALRRIVKKKRYALVTIEGTMRGPEPVKIDPQLPDWLKDRFKGSTQRYGSLGSLKMMIEIEKVVEAKEVDDGLVSGVETPHR